MAWTCQVHRPRQVIVVALLTSIFWFALNTVILVSYQVNIASNELKAAHSFRQENNEDDLLGFERQWEDTNKAKKILPRGISEVGFEGEEFDITNNEILLQHKSNRDTQVTRNGLINRNKEESLKKGHFDRNIELKTRKKKPKILKNKLISAVKSIEPDDPKKEHNTNIGGGIISHPHDPNGPGENGKAVLISAKEKTNEKDGYSKYAFNEYASSKISLERSIPDTRSSG